MTPPSYHPILSNTILAPTNQEIILLLKQRDSSNLRQFVLTVNDGIDTGIGHSKEKEPLLYSDVDATR